MAFTPKTWVGRSVEFPGQIKLIPTGEPGVYRLERHEGTVYSDGDLVSDTALNDLERRIGAGMPNHNCLRNFWFLNPVNQRGVSGTISTPGYFIDGWILVSGTVTLTANGLTLNGTISQILEFAVGTGFTASTVMHSGTATASYNNSTRTFAITSSGGTVRMAKLEKGTISTAANDAPPAFGLQLALCQRYLILPTYFSRYRADHVDANNVDFTIPVPVTMRTTPTITKEENLKVRTIAGVEHTGFTFAIVSAPKNCIAIRATKTSHGLSDAQLYLDNSGIGFSAEI